MRRMLVHAKNTILVVNNDLHIKALLQSKQINLVVDSIIFETCKVSLFISIKSDSLKHHLFENNSRTKLSISHEYTFNKRNSFFIVELCDQLIDFLFRYNDSQFDNDFLQKVFLVHVVDVVILDFIQRFVMLK